MVKIHISFYSNHWFSYYNVYFYGLWTLDLIAAGASIMLKRTNSSVNLLKGVVIVGVMIMIMILGLRPCFTMIMIMLLLMLMLC